VALAWTPGSNGGSAITGYLVEKSPNGTSSWTTVTTTGAVLTYTVTGLTNGTIQYFRVSAVNGVGTGPVSNVRSATPVVVTAPGAPTLNTATPGDTQVSLGWSAPGSNGGSAITGYLVEKSPNGTSSWTTAATLGVVLTYTVTGLTNGTIQHFRVSAINGIGTGTASNVLSATPAVAGGATPKWEETFTGTNGATWMSTGKWDFHEPAGRHTIQANRGVIDGDDPGGSAICTTYGLTGSTSGTGGATWLLTWDMSVDDVTTIDQLYFILGFGNNGSSDGSYWLESRADGNFFKFRYADAADIGTSSSIPGGVASGQIVHYKVRLVGGNDMKAKAWKDGEAEPAGWLIQGTGTYTGAQTRVVFQCRTFGGAVTKWRFDNFRMYADPDAVTP
jgi:hypothetical protein